ncbi:MAG: amidohydrolase [Nitrososphaerota archaeon]|nr:amidohydrolase [Nitrososphaerota archaeon]MDG6923333.1 amidohydrolase [Nitrososphaerota archaeon]
MIIDTHSHMYGKGVPETHDRYVSRLPQLGIDIEHEVEFYIKLMNRTGVDKTLIYCNPNESVAEMIKGNRDRFVPFATINLGDGKAAAEQLERAVASLGYRGIAEQSPASNDYYIDDFDLLDPIYRKASDLGVPVSWHLQNSWLTGSSRIKFSGIERVQEVCVRYPDLKILLCHMGGEYQKTMSACSGYKNVYMDLSGITGGQIRKNMAPVWGKTAMGRSFSYIHPEFAKEGKPKDYGQVMTKSKNESAEIIREIASVLPDRIMMGTDGLFASTPDIEIDVCKTALGHDKELLAHVLGDNARKFLNV